jgi:hypothetical protein
MFWKPYKADGKDKFSGYMYVRAIGETGSSVGRVKTHYHEVSMKTDNIPPLQ